MAEIGHHRDKSTTMVQTGMWKTVVISVSLAAAAQPIHEAGHAVAVRLFTGVWPRFTLWAVFPPKITSQEAVLAILAAGDMAVVLWWAVLLACIRRRPAWKLGLIGPSFMTAIAMAIHGDLVCCRRTDAVRTCKYRRL